MAEKLTFFGDTRNRRDIHVIFMGESTMEGAHLQRCQQLSCLLHKPVCTHIKAQLDSSIIKPSSLPAASSSASSERENAREGGEGGGGEKGNLWYVSKK